MHTTNRLFTPDLATVKGSTAQTIADTRRLLSELMEVIATSRALVAESHRLLAAPIRWPFPEHDRGNTESRQAS